MTISAINTKQAVKRSSLPESPRLSGTAATDEAADGAVGPSFVETVSAPAPAGASAASADKAEASGPASGRSSIELLS